MSAKLFNESPQSDRPQYHQKAIKRIDDLILDAEQEAEAEINRKIRSTNTRALLLVLVGVGLFYVLFTGIQNNSIPVPSFLVEESQVAVAPPAPPGPVPKPIPFPVTQSAPGTAEATTVPPVLDEQLKDGINPLETAVLSMIEKNLREPGKPITEPTAPASMKPTQPIAPAVPVLKGKSPFTPETQTPAAPAEGAVQAVARQLPSNEMTLPGVSPPKIAVPKLTAEQSEFIIQVGAYSVKANADRVIRKLMSGGYSPLVQIQTARSSMHVIYIGGFADDKSPQNMITELKKKGLNPSLKKNDNGSYSIILGKEKSRGKAEALKQKLTKKGIFTSLKQMKINSRIFIVRIGGFDSNTNARLNQKKIEGMGYKGTLIRKKS